MLVSRCIIADSRYSAWQIDIFGFRHSFTCVFKIHINMRVYPDIYHVYFFSTEKKKEVWSFYFRVHEAKKFIS